MPSVVEDAQKDMVAHWPDVAKMWSLLKINLHYSFVKSLKNNRRLCSHPAFHVGCFSVQRRKALYADTSKMLKGKS
ncbi:Glutamyl-Q tRNA(Asp) synthetase [Trichinella pseudospiralis]